MTRAQLFAAIFVAAAALAVAAVRGGWLKRRPRRVRHASLDAQIAADFAPEHRAEARAIVGEVLAHADPEQHTQVWRSLLDGTRGDIARLRRVKPKAIESLARLYRLMGGGPGDAPAASTE